MKTLGEGQKLIFKGCYSRPLYPFNAKLNAELEEKEDFAWLTEGAKKEQQKGIVDKLLTKVTELEQKVTGDVNRKYFDQGQAFLGDGFDTQSNFETTSNAPASAMGANRSNSLWQAPKAGQTEQLLSKMAQLQAGKSRGF